MTKIEAWYRRNFCLTTQGFGSKVGEVTYSFYSQPIKYIYVGKGKVWIKKTKNKK